MVLTRRVFLAGSAAAGFLFHRPKPPKPPPATGTYSNTYANTY